MWFCTWSSWIHLSTPTPVHRVIQLHTLIFSILAMPASFLSYLIRAPLLSELLLGYIFYCCSSVSLKRRDKTCNQPAHQLEGKCRFSIPGRLHLKSWLHLVATYSLYPESEFRRRSNLLIYKENKSYKNRARQNASKTREEEDAKIICNSTAHTTRRKNDKCLSPHG